VDKMTTEEAVAYLRTVVPPIMPAAKKAVRTVCDALEAAQKRIGAMDGAFNAVQSALYRWLPFCNGGEYDDLIKDDAALLFGHQYDPDIREIGNEILSSLEEAQREWNACFEQKEDFDKHITELQKELAAAQEELRALRAIDKAGDAIRHDALLAVMRQRDEAKEELRKIHDQKPYGWIHCRDGDFRLQKPMPIDERHYKPLYAAPVPQPSPKTLYSLGADRVIRKHTTENTSGVYVAELCGWDSGLLGDLLGSAPGAHPPDTFAKTAAQDARDAERYRWLIERVLAADYGDNETNGTDRPQVGWRIRHDLLPKNGGRQPAFMFGSSVNEAIDAAILAAKKEC